MVEVARERDDLVTVVAGLLDPLIARGLAAVLSDDRRIRILAEGLDEDTLARVVVARRPHVAVVGETAQADLLGHLKSGQPPTAVLVVANDPTPQTATLLQVAGATCLNQRASLGEVLLAVRSAALGDRVAFGLGLRSSCVGATGSSILTAREAQVFERLSEGKRYAAVAHEMQISVSTVRTHARAIFRKLGVQSRLALVERSLTEWSDQGRR